MYITQMKPDDLQLARNKRALIAVSPTVSIQTALNLMHTNRITSLPIFSHDSTQVVSIINLFDILLYLVGGEDIVNKENFRLSDPVENVLGLDNDRESYWLHKTDSQDTLLATLGAFASGVHRSLVVDYSHPKENLWLLSQTDIIRHIRSHPDCLKDHVDVHASIADLGLGKSRSLATVSATQSAISGYKLLAEKNLSGVPIVDNDGNLLGDLALEDLPNANLSNAEELSLPCLEYVKKRDASNSLPVGTPETSLEQIIDTLISQDTHRVWIKQDKESQKVIGVVTMSDVIGLICQKVQ